VKGLAVTLEALANGRITNAPISSSFIIYAKTDTKGPASKGITAFLVERKWKGFEVGEHLDKFGVSYSVLVASEQSLLAQNAAD